MADPVSAFDFNTYYLPFQSGGLTPGNTSTTTTSSNPSSYSAPPMGFRMPPPGPGMPPRLPPPGFMPPGSTPGMPPPAFNVPPPGFLNSFSQAGAGGTYAVDLFVVYLFPTVVVSLWIVFIRLFLFLFVLQNLTGFYFSLKFVVS